MPFPQIISRPLLVIFTSALFLVSATSGASASRSLDSSSTSVSFGSVPVGSKRAQYETFTNTYIVSSVTISRASVTGAGFSLSGVSLPATLRPGQSVTFVIAFTPQASGSQTGEITVWSNAWAHPFHSIPISGTGGTAGRLVSNASALNFGAVTVGSSKTLGATLSAVGASVTISSAATTNPEFTLAGLSLPKTISAGQAVSVTMTFKPRASGAASGRISLASNATPTLTVETLTGSGLATKGHAVGLSWSPSASPVVGYNVYRSGSPSGPYTKLTSALEASTNFVDLSVQSGKTYYYVNTAVNSRGAESQRSTQLRAVIPSP